MIYFKLDESLAHSSLNFLLELAAQLRKYFILNFAGRRVNKMHVHLTDKFVPEQELYLRKLSCPSRLTRSENVVVGLAVSFRHSKKLD